MGARQQKEDLATALDAIRKESSGRVRCHVCNTLTPEEVKTVDHALAANERRVVLVRALERIGHAGVTRHHLFYHQYKCPRGPRATPSP